MSKYEYTIYRANGMTETTTSSKWSLDQLQEAVGGLIEMPPQEFTNLPGAYNTYINEEGKLLGLPMNVSFKPTAWGDYLAGDVVIERWVVE